MADDAAEILSALGIDRAHVCGFSGGSCTAQELALRHPELVRSLVLVSTSARSDAFLRAMTSAWTWLPAAAPSERAMLEAFFTWIYTPRAHESGMVQAIIEEALAFPHPQSPEAFIRQLETWIPHDTFDRLPQISVPTSGWCASTASTRPRASTGRVSSARIGRNAPPSRPPAPANSTAAAPSVAPSAGSCGDTWQGAPTSR